MARLAVFVASSAEIKKDLIPARMGSFEISVCYTGLGKVRSALSAQALLLKSPFDHAINLGTAGSHLLAPGTLTEVESFVERDVDLSVAGIKPGFFPGAEGQIKSGRKYFRDLPAAICGSGDRIDLRPPAVACDIYDMEAFGIALACQKLGLSLVALKYITDTSKGAVAEDWKKNLNQAQESLFGAFQQFIKIIS